MEVFKVNIRSHLKSGDGIVIGLLVAFGGPYILSLMDGSNYLDLIFVGVIILFLFVLPTLIIHINYFLINMNDVLVYYESERLINISHNGVKSVFHLDDIVLVKRSMSFNFAAGRSKFTLWDGYNHSYILLKNGQQFTITSLLVPNLNLPIDQNKITVAENFYRLAIDHRSSDIDAGV